MFPPSFRSGRAVGKEICESEKKKKKKKKEEVEQNRHIHSNSPYPGSLGPGTARNSETPGSWNNPTVPQNKYDLVYTDINIYTF